MLSSHCSKSSFFVQKFNFDFLSKLSIFGVKNSWNCCGFGLFSCWQLWFYEKNCQKKFRWKTRENVVVLDFLAVDNFDFTRKIVKKIWWKCWGFVKIEFLDKNLTFRIRNFSISDKKRLKNLVKLLRKLYLKNWNNLTRIFRSKNCEFFHFRSQNDQFNAKSAEFGLFM